MKQPPRSERNGRPERPPEPKPAERRAWPVFRYVKPVVPARPRFTT
jgi:hypothetical protein